MRRAVVTGASGFIGSWLAMELLEQGYSVSVVARDQKRLIPEVRCGCRIVEKSLQELEPVDFPSAVDVFFHLAWEGVSSEKKNEMNLQLDNIRTSIEILEIAGRIGCGRFVAAGTVAEYALCDGVMDLTARPIPNDLYGAAKVSAHCFLEVQARQLDLPFLWGIIPSTFGERRSDQNIITYTIKSLLRKKKPLYGDLWQLWDFLYVQDVVRALRLIGEKGIPGKVYGIGSGEYRTLRDYVCRIRDVIDPTLPLGIGENDAWFGKTFGSCVNNYDLIKDTGFKQKFTFEEGIARTVQYYRKHIG